MLGAPHEHLKIGRQVVWGRRCAHSASRRPRDDGEYEEESYRSAAPHGVQPNRAASPGPAEHPLVRPCARLAQTARQAQHTTVLLEVALVVFLGAMERRRGTDLGGDGAGARLLLGVA